MAQPSGFFSWIRNYFSPQKFKEVYAIGVPEGQDRFGEHVRNVVDDLAKKLGDAKMTATSLKLEDLKIKKKEIAEDCAIVVVLITQGRVGDEIEVAFPKELLEEDNKAETPQAEEGDNAKAAVNTDPDKAEDNKAETPQAEGGDNAKAAVNTDPDKADDSKEDKEQKGEVIAGNTSGDKKQKEEGRKLILLVVQDDEYVRYSKEDLPDSLKDKIDHVFNIHVIPGQSRLHSNQNCRNNKVIEELKEILKK